jgi:tetratricopeptide (TPR) repeat protein
MRFRGVFIPFWCAAWLTVSHVAWTAEDTPAQRAERHLQRGMRAFQQERFAEARRELQESYAEDPRPELLYAIAQTYRHEGQCREAIQYYARFLGTHPPAADADASRTNQERCRKRLEAVASVRKPEPEAARGEDKESPMPEGARTEWWTDWFGHALVGAGLVGVGTGSVVLATARKDTDHYNDAGNLDRFIAERADAEAAARRQRIGAATLGVGGALVVGAVVRYVYVAAARHSEPPPVSVQVGGGGAVATWTGRF